MSVRRILYEPGGRRLRLENFPDPEPPPGGFLAEVVFAGVCGTDVHRLAGDLPAPTTAIALGHEAVGVVTELPREGATDSAGRALKRGDRIAWFSPAACGRCHSCTIDRDPAICEALAWPYPGDQDGSAGFQDIAAIGPHVPVFLLPDELPLDAASAFGCAMPTALSALDRVGELPIGSVAVVLGSGPVGLAATLALSQRGFGRLIVVGTGQQRLAAARAFGATDILDIAESSAGQRRDAVLDISRGRGADLVFEAAGFAAAFADGMELLAARGTLAIVGLYSGAATTLVDPVHINNQQLRIIGSLGSSPSHLARGIELMARAQTTLRIDRLVAPVQFPLEQTEEAIRALGSGTIVKALVAPGAGKVTDSP